MLRITAAQCRTQLVASQVRKWTDFTPGPQPTIPRHQPLVRLTVQLLDIMALQVLPPRSRGMTAARNGACRGNGYWTGTYLVKRGPRCQSARRRRRSRSGPARPYICRLSILIRVAFDEAGVPLQGEPGYHGVLVPAQPGHEGPQFGLAAATVVIHCSSSRPRC
jgi:hypothetical protein